MLFFFFFFLLALFSATMRWGALAPEKQIRDGRP